MKMSSSLLNYSTSIAENDASSGHWLDSTARSSSAAAASRAAAANHRRRMGAVNPRSSLIIIIDCHQESECRVAGHQVRHVRVYVHQRQMHTAEQVLRQSERLRWFERWATVLHT